MTLPNFLIAGAAKAGTTVLSEMVGGHPDVFVAPRKESHFLLFDGHAPAFSGPGDEVLARDFIVTDRDRYEGLFDRADRAKAVGEASVFYLYRPEAFVRARELMGDDVRVVVVLRDPAERVFSGYAHLVRDGRETASSFAEALECEDERVASGWEYIWHHRRLGSYSRQLECLFDVIGRDRVLVLRHEDLADNPLGTCVATFDFLGVDSTYQPPPVRSSNPGGQPRSQTLVRLLHHATVAGAVARKVVPRSIRQCARDRIVRWNLRPVDDPDHGRDQLRATLAPDVRATARITGLDLDAWLPSGRPPVPASTWNPVAAPAPSRVS